MCSLSKDSLKDLGLEDMGCAYLLGKTKQRERVDRVFYMDYNRYSFGKILDLFRMKSAHSKKLVDGEPAFPVVCDSDTSKENFEAVVDYLFPGECSKLILG